MSNDKAPKPTHGATITIQQYPTGLTIGVEFYGQPMDESAREGMQDMALTGVDAMRDWVREHCSTKGEEVIRRPEYAHKKPTTH